MGSLDLIKNSFSRNQVFLVYLASYYFPTVLVSKFFFYYVIVYFRLVSVATEDELLFTLE